MKKLLCLVCVLASALTAYADRAAVSFSSGTAGGGTSFNGGVGFRFTDLSATTVTALGLYDVGSDGFSQAHEVSLWDSNGVLLATVTIPAGTTAPVVAGFRYVTLPVPVLLVPGQTYDVRAFFPASDDLSVFGASGFVIDPTLQYVTSEFGGNSSSPNSPDLVGGFYNPGFFGPGMQLADVPEPSIVSLCAAAILGTVLVRWRRWSARQARAQFVE